MPEDASPPRLDYAPPGRSHLAEVARLFLRLGFTAFGGPAAHVALMEDEVVHRRGWLDRRHFLDIVSAVNFVPGPNSTELAIHVGWERAGWRGLVVAGVCFVTPAMLIILPIAGFYVAYGRTPRVEGALWGIKAGVLAIVAVAAVRFARSGVRDAFAAGVAVAALAAAVILRFYGVPQQELIVLAVAAAAGVLRYFAGGGRRPGEPGTPNPAPAHRTEVNAGDRNPTPPATMLALPLALVPATGFAQQTAQMAFFFLKVGATLFGSGYVLASFLQTGLVEHHGWLTNQELLDAIAVGQVTPGPLLTAATFVGYVLGARNFGGGVPGGVLGGVVATAAIFLPSFLFIAVLGPVLPRIRQNPCARAALDGMNAAVVSLIFVVTVWLGRSALLHDAGGVRWLAATVFGASLVILLATRLNPTWLIVAAGVVGAVLPSA